MGEGDQFAWNFYHDYVSGFVQDFGLMPMLIKNMGLHGKAKQLFLKKLGMIHASMLRIQQKKWGEK